MKCSAFIATSTDGYIATLDGAVEWLHSAGNTAADMGNEDMGFQAFMDSVDCMIMGRKCMEMIASMNLTPEQWPYGNVPIYVLSHRLSQPPQNLMGKVTMYAGDIHKLISKLDAQGLQHCYVDGGTTITAFINLKLLNRIIITQAPILLGAGVPLFGHIESPIKLVNATSQSFANDFVQLQYDVVY